MTTPHSGQMEVAIANLIGYRLNTIVPNVSWGMGFRHECDMLILDSQNRFTEIEIKVSKSDLKADFKKAHGHSSKIISRLVYAVPRNLLESALELVPQRCGIIVVDEIEKYGKLFYVAKWHRVVRHDKQKSSPTPAQIRKFMELGCMRIWSLKSHYNRSK